MFFFVTGVVDVCLRTEVGRLVSAGVSKEGAVVGAADVGSIGTGAIDIRLRVIVEGLDPGRVVGIGFRIGSSIPTSVVVKVVGSSSVDMLEGVSKKLMLASELRLLVPSLQVSLRRAWG